MIVRAISGILLAAFCTSLPACADTPKPMAGMASVYGYDGQKTASGELSKASELTAAHRTLPFGTKVRVTNRKTGKSVVVRINDRGPFIKGRIIDVTPKAAAALGFSGLAPVELSLAN